MGDYVYIDGGEMSQTMEEGDDVDDFHHTMSESRAPAPQRGESLQSSQ